ncbi:MAG: adenylosuccinate lyase, partial [Planctomycetota bacterium]|nr:adenylosuccinate lyase [Planctomycetota bacterium]
MSHDCYENPLITRYSSPQMAGIWGDQNRYSTWRKLWIALAESQQELGLEISDAQIEEMRTSI